MEQPMKEGELDVREVFYSEDRLISQTWTYVITM